MCSGILSVVCFMVGIVASYDLSAPTGASIVLANLAAFCLFWLAGRLGVRA